MSLIRAADQGYGRPTDLQRTASTTEEAQHGWKHSPAPVPAVRQGDQRAPGRGQRDGERLSHDVLRPWHRMEAAHRGGAAGDDTGAGGSVVHGRRRLDELIHAATAARPRLSL